MSKIRITLLLLSCVVIGACKNDLDINAPWEEIPVVYGLLDANTNVQYIRIQKAYQNDINTSTDQAAKIADSLVFDTLVVTVRGTDGSSYTLIKTTELPKSPGIFATEKNYLYRANFTPNLSAQYELEMTNPKSGKTYKGRTSIVSPSNILSDSLLIRPHVPSNRLVINFIPTNANVYDVFVRFYYKEYPIGRPADSVIKYVDYVFDRNFTPSGNNAYRKNITTRDWISTIRLGLKVDNSVIREYSRIEYVSVGASLDLYNYYSVSIPSASVVQKRTDYSNIPNALGIFSSRSFTTRNAPLREEANDIGTDSSKIYLVRDLPNFIY